MTGPPSKFMLLGLPTQSCNCYCSQTQGKQERGATRAIQFQAPGAEESANAVECPQQIVVGQTVRDLLIATQFGLQITLRLPTQSVSTKQVGPLFLTFFVFNSIISYFSFVPYYIVSLYCSCYTSHPSFFDLALPRGSLMYHLIRPKFLGLDRSKKNKSCSQGPISLLLYLVHILINQWLRLINQLVD